MCAPLATLTTRPWEDSRSRGKNRFVSKKGPMWFVAYVRSKPSRLKARVPAMPALLTRTSIGWPDARNAWAARRTEPRSETSSDTHCARAAGKRLWSALSTGLVRSSERVASTTRPPQDVEGLQHASVARRDGDLAVGLHVHLVEPVVVVEVLLRRGEQPSHFLQVGGRGVPDSGRDRPDLERLAGAQQIEQQLLGERSRLVRARQHQHLVGAVHVHAGAMADRHQPDGLEALEGFTHGRMPHAEAACH